MRKLTGRFDFRRTLFGDQVLMVEETVDNRWPFSRKRPYRTRWRPASGLDLATPELGALMDLTRVQPAETASVAAERYTAEPKPPELT